MLWVFIGLLMGTLGLNELLFRFSGKDLHYSNATDKKSYEIGEDINLTAVIENKKAISVPFSVTISAKGKPSTIMIILKALRSAPPSRCKRESISATDNTTEPLAISEG